MLRTLLNTLLVFSLCSCSVGDPSQGGLFGWSQSKADARIESRSRELSALEKRQVQMARQAAAAEMEKKQARAKQGDGSRRIEDSPPVELEPVRTVPLVEGAGGGDIRPSLSPPKMTKPSVPDPDQLLIKPPVEKPKF